MSTLFELKDEILKGRRVKRGEWIGYVTIHSLNELDLSDALADDWELESKAKKKVKLYAYWNFRNDQMEMGVNLDQIKAYGYRLPNLDQEIEVDD